MNYLTSILKTIFLAVLLGRAAYAQPAQTMLPGKYSAQGILTPWKTSRVACSESGLVREMLVQPGVSVHKGQQLAALEIDQQAILVAMARISSESTSKVDAAKAEVELNLRRLAAVQAGRANEFTTQSELERAELELRSAQSRLKSEIEQRQAEKLNLQKLEVQLQQRAIFAPLDGTVVRVFKEIGEFVNPSSPEVVEIVDTSRLRATFFMTLDEVRRLTAAGHGVLQVDGENQLTAEIEFVAPIADSESGLIEVRMLVDNPTRQIWGASCHILLDAQSPKSST